MSRSRSKINLKKQSMRYLFMQAPVLCNFIPMCLLMQAQVLCNFIPMGVLMQAQVLCNFIPMGVLLQAQILCNFIPMCLLKQAPCSDLCIHHLNFSVAVSWLPGLSLSYIEVKIPPKVSHSIKNSSTGVMYAFQPSSLVIL